MENKGFLVVLMQPPPTLEEEFNAWYDTEHLPERLRVPGFETGLRYVCVSGAPRYMAMYDMQNAAVLDSPEYLRVSLDKSSPWTRRVVGKVRVYRAGGRQVYPGNAVAQNAPRVLLLRFGQLPASAESTIVAGMRANFESHPETIQVRVFANDTGAAIDFLGMVEARAPLSKPFETRHFGDCRNALDMINEYARYM